MWFLANIVLAVHILIFLLLGAAMVIAAIDWSQMLGNEEIKLRLNDGYSA